jgi:hypothetical protein
MKLGPASTSTKLTGKFSEWSAKHPVLAIVFVSALAVAINCYPIIFCGKSYVAPAVGLPMLYADYPQLPGMTNRDAVQAHGSDTGATMIWGIPLGFVESRSILEYGELPLWNRYSHAGDTLIGQAIGLFPDPLQWIVILGRNAALAYDIKFLLAKLLFSIGFGLLIRRLSGSLPLSLLFAGMAPYSGAFFYIYNHPAFFVFSYAPWILLSALEFLDLHRGKYLGWGLAWLLTNYGCFNAGHVELGVILIGGLNLAALVFALAANRGIFSAAKTIVRLTIGTLLLLGLTAPFWISFLVSLPGTYTIHDKINVTQIEFASLLGMFDDVLYRLPVHPGPFTAPAPATNFLIFVGAIYSMIRWRRLKNDIFFWVNIGALLLWGGCVFGWVPAPVIAAIPFLNRDGHTHTDFSYLLVIHLTIQCAYGFKCLSQETSFRDAVLRLLGVGLIFGGLTLVYCFGFEHGPVPWIYFIPVAVGAFGAAFLFAFLRNRSHVSVSRWVVVGVLAFIPQFRCGLYTFGNDFLVTVLKPRVRLDAPSPAIDTIKADRSQPFRVMGAQEILYGDYAAVYGLEGVTSAAPLSNHELIDLLRGYPGIDPGTVWETNLRNPVAAHGLLNLLNVKYVLTPATVEVQEGLGFRLTATHDLGVLENLNVWPRAFFANKIVPLASTEEFINYLLAHGNQPFAALTPDEIASAPALLSLPANSNSTVAPASNYTLLPNSTAFDIHAPSAGMACLTEGQGRDFIATANGEPKSVLTVNRAFKGIYLDKPGDYRIQFTYRPRHWKLACGIFWTAAGIVAVLVCLCLIRRKMNQSEMPPDRENRVT